MTFLSLGSAVLIFALFIGAIRKVGTINGVTLFVASYFAFVVPKYLVMTLQQARTSYYYRNIVLTDQYLVDLSFLLVSLFVVALLLSFLLFLPRVRVQSRAERGEVVVRSKLAYMFLFPAGLVISALLFSRMGIDLAVDFSQKRDFLAASGEVNMVNYLLIKAAYIVKIPFYMYLYQYPTLRNRRGLFRLTAALSLLFGFVLHVVFSQRSGVLFMVLDVLFLVSALRPLRARWLLSALGLLFALNVGVLWFRAAWNDFTQLFVLLFFRRYFMDVEKVSNILAYVKASSTNLGATDLLGDSFFSSFAHFRLPEDIHFFVGREIMGLSSIGVPPSIVGEVILRMGTVWLIPVAILIGYGLKRLDMLRFRVARTWPRSWRR